ncbi:hypothetical protein [Ancylobacter radicis]|uniref:Uncharacterized protein n=1 Tax=Ancylobacter radicis TaxID=2836179 RepID=A0ABS5R3G4_9HYPH|nr:hypothetical protein [Ancylobacter radicis]MBS9476198.1 hypothetical protein [Ancylobacter radicis]
MNTALNLAPASLADTHEYQVAGELDALADTYARLIKPQEDNLEKLRALVARLRNEANAFRRRGFDHHAPPSEASHVG